MIGNDIVDLQCAGIESNWQRKGWLQKLFTEAEQQQIMASEQPEQMVWLLWSMKESAYKIWNRSTGLSRFMPLRLVCSVAQVSAGTAYGKVVVEEQIYRTSSRVAPDFIHTLALEQNNFREATVYIGGMAETISIPGYAMLRDERGLPFLYSSTADVTRPASLSHHGRFEAIAHLD